MTTKGFIKTHCIRGHELTADNVYISPSNNKRRCVQCEKERQAHNSRVRSLAGKLGGRPACRPYEALYRRLLRTAKSRSIPREVAISYEEFVEFTKISECHYCSSIIKWAVHRPGENGTSAGYHLDRKDNNLGYTKGNSVVCCNRCNSLKLNLFTYEEWVVMTAALKEYHDTIARAVNSLPCKEGQNL